MTYEITRVEIGGAFYGLNDVIQITAADLLKMVDAATHAAREECADICKLLQNNDFCVDVREAEKEIRKTIK